MKENLRMGTYDGFGIFYSTLGIKYKGYFKKCLSIAFLFLSYKIFLFLYHIYSKIMKNKMAIFLIIILILGILIN